ncbi:MAG TPA: molybdopterin-dependent oxidoreductase [Methanocella sp.]|nr:molybdopterin-dependent oxidoreductase [Methanocella sp.]
MLKKLPALDVEGPPLADPQQWRLKVDGLVEQPATLDIQGIREMEPVETTQPIICVEGWDMWVKWKGIRVSQVIDRVKPRPEAQWLTFYSYGEYTDSLSMADARDGRAMLVYGMDGGDLPAENGGPLRLVVPFKLAYKSVKWVTRIRFTDAEELGYWEVRGYPAEAGIPVDKREEYGL